MPSFEDLGLRQELLRALEDGDIERPTALQEAVIPVLRRGSNLVARASSGSGKTFAYALGILDRLKPREDEDGDESALRLLVLVATQDMAERIALSMYPFVQAAGMTVTVPGGAWGMPATAAEVLVAPPADIMDAVRSSMIKLENLEAIVVDGASTIHQLGDWERVDALMDDLPRDAQRVVVSAAFPDEVRDLIDRRVKRALTYPAESVIAEEQNTPRDGRIGFVLAREGDKLEVLSRQLAQPTEDGGAPPVVFCRSDERAADLAEELTVRGFVVGSVDDQEADVAVVAADATREELMEEAEGELGQSISYDVPADRETLLARHGGDPDAVVVIDPREQAHLKEIARQANLKARSLPLPVDRGATTTRLNAFREELRRAVREEDLAAQLLVLDPLLDEFGALEVAAAAAALLRQRRPAAAPAATAATPAAPVQRAAEAGPAPATFARLFVSVGSRDEIRPGDLVGALAGEANIQGSKIGRIDIRESFSIVEIDSSVADQVIRAVNGTTVKGRSVRVDYDRGAERSRAGSGPPRRQSRPGGPGGSGGGGASGGARRIVRRPPDRE